MSKISIEFALLCSVRTQCDDRTLYSNDGEDLEIGIADPEGDIEETVRIKIVFTGRDDGIDAIERQLQTLEKNSGATLREIDERGLGYL